jgi:hypothetical protein
LKVDLANFLLCHLQHDQIPGQHFPDQVKFTRFLEKPLKPAGTATPVRFAFEGEQLFQDWTDWQAWRQSPEGRRYDRELCLKMVKADLGIPADRLA